MSEHHYDVVGIGNAIVDIIARCDDTFLTQHDAPKGHMRLVDAETISSLYDAIGPAVEISGGSAANTIAGVASLGGKAAYIGKVADDEFGRIFAHDIKSIGVDYRTQPANGAAPTARSIILVTPDGERTMNTFLGISPELGAKDLDHDLITAGKILYLEGYLFDSDAAKDCFRQAAQIAKQAGRLVSMTLSDGFCVDRHRDAFLEFIRSDVDIVFANESEVTSLYEVDNFDIAAEKISRDVKLAALTRSEKGSIIISADETATIPAYPVKKLVDTTGAGDLYAAGFLFGYARNLDIGICGRLGCLAASEIISHIGARPEMSLLELAKSKSLL